MTGRATRTILPVLRACGLLAALLLAGSAGAQDAAPADWRADFEAVCVKTDVALSLSNEELADLVAQCDRLAERIGAETEIVRRIFLKRLQSCRALFAYVLEARSAVPAAGGAPAAAEQSPAAPQPPAADAPAPESRPAP